MIYHLHYGIVSIIYSDHAEIPGKLSKGKEVASSPETLVPPPAPLTRVRVKRNRSSVSRPVVPHHPPPTSPGVRLPRRTRAFAGVSAARPPAAASGAEPRTSAFGAFE